MIDANFRKENEKQEVVCDQVTYYEKILIELRNDIEKFALFIFVLNGSIAFVFYRRINQNNKRFFCYQNDLSKLNETVELMERVNYQVTIYYLPVNQLARISCSYL